MTSMTTEHGRIHAMLVRPAPWTEMITSVARISCTCCSKLRPSKSTTDTLNVVLCACGNDEKRLTLVSMSSTLVNLRAHFRCTNVNSNEDFCSRWRARPCTLAHGSASRSIADPNQYASDPSMNQPDRFLFSSVNLVTLRACTWCCSTAHVFVTMYSPM